MPFLKLLRADGGVSILQYVAGADPQTEVLRWAATADPTWLPLVSAAVTAKPTLSRRFRAAWRHNGTGIFVDLAAARAVRKAEILAERDVRIARLRDRIEAADDGGDSVTLTLLKLRRRTLRALDTGLDAQLAGMADVAALETFLPAEFGTED